MYKQTACRAVLHPHWRIVLPLIKFIQPTMFAAVGPFGQEEPTSRPYTRWVTEIHHFRRHHIRLVLLKAFNQRFDQMAVELGVIVQQEDVIATNTQSLPDTA